MAGIPRAVRSGHPGTRHGERHPAALRLSGGEGGSRRVRRRRMRLPELFGGLAKADVQPIRLRILGHHRPGQR